MDYYWIKKVLIEQLNMKVSFHFVYSSIFVQSFQFQTFDQLTQSVRYLYQNKVIEQTDNSRILKVVDCLFV